VIEVKVSAEEQKLKEFEALKEKIKAEQAKPLTERNYDEIKKALTAIVQAPDAGKAARYAELTLKQVAGFELAQKVSKEIGQQDSYLKKTTQGIDKAANTRLAGIKDTGKYIVIGKFQESSVFVAELSGGKYYRIIGKSGATTCYAVPAGSAVQMDLSKFLGKEVGLVGSIKPHQPTATAIVEFTDIIEMK
jgi:hypothetical protein